MNREEEVKLLAKIEYHKKAIEKIKKRIKRVDILLVIGYLYLVFYIFFLR